MTPGGAETRRVRVHAAQRRHLHHRLVKRSQRPRRDRAGVPRWPAAALAILVMAACGFGGANSAPVDAGLSCLALGLAAAILWVAEVPLAVVKRASPVLALLGGFLLWCALAALALGGTRAQAGWLALGLVDAGGKVALFCAAAASGVRLGNCRGFAVWLTGGGAMLMVATLAMRLMAVVPAWLPAMEDPLLHRFSGTIGNPNAAAVAFAMLAVVAAGVARSSHMAWRERREDRRLLGMLAGLAVMVAGSGLVILTQSRTGLVLVLAALAGFAGAGLRPVAGGWRGWLVGLGALGLGGLAVLVLAARTVDRMSPLGADGVARIAIWRHYGALAASAPLIGHGLGSFDAVNTATLTADTAPLFWNFGAAHAAPLQLALETGWVGLGLVLAAMGLVLARIVRQLRPRENPVGLAMLLAVLVAMAASLVDIALNVPGIAAMALVLAGLGWGRALRGQVRIMGPSSGQR